MQSIAGKIPVVTPEEVEKAIAAVMEGRAKVFLCGDSHTAIVVEDVFGTDFYSKYMVPEGLPFWAMYALTDSMRSLDKLQQRRQGVSQDAFA